MLSDRQRHVDQEASNQPLVSAGLGSVSNIHRQTSLRHSIDMNFTVISVFPEMFASPLDCSILKRAQEKQLLSVRFLNPREFTEDRHRMTDDYPYGGGQGMIMKPEPLIKAIQEARRSPRQPRVVLLSPRGRVFDQQFAAELMTHEEVVLVCGRYEGVDERVVPYVDALLSIGDYTTSGGEIPAMVVIETVTRLVPGVLGNEKSAGDDSFVHGLLEYPQYTRPPEYEGARVPPVLLSGNHANVREWRLQMSMEITRRHRPDLLTGSSRLDAIQADPRAPARIFIALVHFPVNDKNGQIITSSITNLDIHDIARCCRTYGVDGFYVVNPVTTLQKLAAKIIDHWEHGYGSTYNDTRKEALALVRLSDTLHDAIDSITDACGKKPVVVATSARTPPGTNRTTFTTIREMLKRDSSPLLVLLGTGWGLADSVLSSSDYILEAIEGRDSYNHLSVRGAAAIILDRILGTGHPAN